jgi:hypothetical protein
MKLVKEPLCPTGWKGSGTGHNGLEAALQTCTERCLVGTLDGPPAILTEDFRGFPQLHPENEGILHK